MAQEQRAAQLAAGIIPYIYRPSSVYGFSGPGGRAGLVTTLIQNAMRYNPSRIFGRFDTIRDYVLAGDIGEFAAQRMDQPAKQPEHFLLASGRPTSMYEVINTVSKVMGRRLYLKLDTEPSNASHISYRKSAFPTGWLPTDLETGIKRVARQLSSSFEDGVAIDR
jgi:UDP-glucose 4-epimerase